MSKGIGIYCADIYLEFPELMEEEFIELCNFLDDEHIKYTGATERFKESEIKINQLNSKIYGKDEYIKILENSNKNLQSKIDKAIEMLESQLPICIMPNNMLIHGTEKAKAIEKTLDILKEDK